MTPHRPRTWQQRLGELLLTTDPTQRLRLAQALRGATLPVLPVILMVGGSDIRGAS